LKREPSKEIRYLRSLIVQRDSQNVRLKGVKNVHLEYKVIWIKDKLNSDLALVKNNKEIFRCICIIIVLKHRY
jgi:hypothetical protein